RPCARKRLATKSSAVSPSRGAATEPVLFTVTGRRSSSSHTYDAAGAEMLSAGHGPRTTRMSGRGADGAGSDDAVDVSDRVRRDGRHARAGEHDRRQGQRVGGGDLDRLARVLLPAGPAGGLGRRRVGEP